MQEDEHVAEPTRLLTDRQLQVFNFMVGFTRDRFYQPSIREIGHEMGIKSPNGVMSHLRAIESKGLIDLSPRREGRKFSQARAIHFIRRTPIEHTPAPEPTP